MYLTSVENAAAFRLSLPTQGGQYVFLPEQIVRLEAKSNYTNFHFRDRKPILSARVLKDYAQQLEPLGFIRTHRSHLVNKRFIKGVDNSGSLLMADASRTEISRRKRREVMKALEH